MNYYIDFDNTLYNTNLLTKDMCNYIATEINKSSNIDLNICIEEVTSNFNREHIYNIYELCDFFSQKYNLNSPKLKSNIDKIILTSSKNVYNDSVDFLKSLREIGHTVNLLSYVTHENLSYQLLKLNGSKLSKYLDDIIISSKYKFNLDLNYEDGIFVDDNPRDLEGLYNKNAKKVIRIKRENNKYSTKEINVKLDNYTSLKDVPITSK